MNNSSHVKIILPLWQIIRPMWQIILPMWWIILIAWRIILPVSWIILTAWRIIHACRLPLVDLLCVSHSTLLSQSITICPIIFGGKIWNWDKSFRLNTLGNIKNAAAQGGGGGGELNLWCWLCRFLSPKVQRVQREQLCWIKGPELPNFIWRESQAKMAWCHAFRNRHNSFHFLSLCLLLFLWLIICLFSIFYSLC